MTLMGEKLATIGPEMVLSVGALLCLFLGLARSARVRHATPLIAGVSLVLCIVGPMAWSAARPAAPGEIALVLGLAATPMAAFLKITIASIGLLLLLVSYRTPDQLPQNIEIERSGAAFDPGQTTRGEFFAFFLMSLAGAMLCAGADGLVWLFLALELTSLPTYIMLVTTRQSTLAREATVKYFFLGALAVAMFLYGFTLIYGATGVTQLYTTPVTEGLATVQSVVAEWRQEGQPLPLMLLVGMGLAILGISFKIAAVPMHLYTADVYQGATTPMTAFLAFVPKTAGFASLVLLLGTLGWPLPEPIAAMLWIMAVLTMTVGNVLGLMQTSVKRALAYSSIAHSGYMLVGLLAGSAAMEAGQPVVASGIAGILFYLVAYGVANLASFGVLGCLKRQGEEAETYQDISGLHHRHPWLAAIMLISLLSLIGLPPLVGFLGKIYLFAPAFFTGEPAMIWLVVIALINSAISAVYYLRIAAAIYFGQPSEEVERDEQTARMTGSGIAATAAVVLGLGAGALGLTDMLAKAADQPGKVLIQPADTDGDEAASEDRSNIPSATAGRN
ncbi:MAG: NADH-quinone oxidoreductase subunit N [Phycisphaeraceae bacterium]|nr:NADH-quinone oxidoreductase subunit N [Phycisphaeraceae bacterium]